MSSNNNIDLRNIISKTNDGVKIPLKVSAGASKTKIIGLYGSALKVAVNAPHEQGKANQALIRLMEKSLGVSKKQIKIITGQTSKIKIVEIIGIDLSDCISKINKLL